MNTISLLWITVLVVTGVFAWYVHRINKSQKCWVQLQQNQAIYRKRATQLTFQLTVFAAKHNLMTATFFDGLTYKTWIRTLGLSGNFKPIELKRFNYLSSVYIKDMKLSVLDCHIMLAELDELTSSFALAQHKQQAAVDLENFLYPITYTPPYDKYNATMQEALTIFLNSSDKPYPQMRILITAFISGAITDAGNEELDDWVNADARNLHVFEILSDPKSFSFKNGMP